MKRKQKRVLSLIVTLAMLVSAVGITAAAEPTKEDVQAAIGTDTDSEPMPFITVDEKEEIKKEAEEETRESTGEGTSEESGEETEEETAESTEEVTTEPTEEETGEITGEETEESTEEETAKVTEEETAEETIDAIEEETVEEATESTAEETVESTKEAVEPTEEETVEETEEAHRHSWSVDWNYDGICHWHECNVNDCPVADDSEKEGYGEHSYDEHGICIDCGYDAMEGIALAAAGDIPTYREAYEIMTALKDEYPEGMTWTNFEPYGTRGELGSAYTWKGGAIYGAKSAVGCMAFVFILSDEVFGSLPARAIEQGSFTFEDVKVGDILRVQGNSHSVIVLQKTAGGVNVAEANYKGTVHWGRSISAADVENADFIITRYPKDYVPADDPEADEVAWEGTAGNLNWSLTNAGVLTISGDGAIPDYSPNSSPWSGYEVYTVVIEEGVTGIGDYAFYQSDVLSVYLPDSLKTIGRNAFRESALVAVTIPGTVRTIGDNGFYNCENLTSVTVSEGVTTIGDHAFHGCTALGYIDFPASIGSVGAGAFDSCENMVSVRFMPGSGKVTLGDGLFMGCWHLSSVTLPQTADSISGNMFSSCSSLPSLYIPASVRSIGENPFTSCRALGVIYFGGSQAQWDSMMTPYLKAMLQTNGTTVVCDAVFDDPFATDPDDPGDFLPGENEPCTDHVDTDNDGRCDNCGEPMSTDTPGTDDGDKEETPGTDDGDEEETPGTDDGDGDETPGTDDGNGDKTPGTDGGDEEEKNDPSASGGSDSATTEGSDDDSSDSSDDESDESGNSTISTIIGRGPDGSRIVTRTQRDGTVVTTTTDPAGKTETKVQLSGLGIDTAEKSRQAAALPVSPVQAVKDLSTAPTIQIHTERDQLVKVLIPTVLPTAGTVAVIVNEDGSTHVIKDSVPTWNGVEAYVPNGAVIKIVDNSKSFSDIPSGAWYENAVSFISARDLFYGTTETAFMPEIAMTYAMAATALARFDGAQTDGGRTWYEKSMEWAAVRGIRDGSAPDSNITCEQLVTMLWKYQGCPAAAEAVTDFGAAGQISDAQKAMDWAMKNGIANGFAGGALEPWRQLNRGQAAQIIMNLAKKITVNSPR